MILPALPFGGQVSFYDFQPPLADLCSEVLAGLQKHPKSLSPKFFYDAQGSRLFSEICQLAEYYPTRTEMRLLKKNAAEIAAFLGEDFALIEYGCGSSEKVRLLLDAARGCRTYVAIDISKTALLQLTQGLAATYPQLPVVAVCADFLQRVEIPLSSSRHLRKIAFFPGSSIGNFDPPDALHFLKHLSQVVGTGGGLLIGVDLKKNVDILHAAYNDAHGVTAAFNLNLLARINRECHSDFDLTAFAHHAFYNEALGRIEMHLLSTKRQEVGLGGHRIAFAAQESIHTENSYKYHLEEFQTLARGAGWRAVHSWVDEKRWMSVQFFQVL